MSVAVHIHVLEGASPTDVSLYFEGTLGSKHYRESRDRHNRSMRSEAADRLHNTPCVYIGDASWLAAACGGERATCVPGPVDSIHELVGENLPIITGELIEHVVASFTTDNHSEYAVGDQHAVKAFLETHRGKSVFIIGW